MIFVPFIKLVSRGLIRVKLHLQACDSTFRAQLRSGQVWRRLLLLRSSVAPHHHLLGLDGVVHCGEDRRATAIDFVQVIKESNQDYLRVTYNLSLTRHQELWDEVERRTELL